jgi:hypothetical protein
MSPSMTAQHGVGSELNCGAHQLVTSNSANDQPPRHRRRSVLIAQPTPSPAVFRVQQGAPYEREERVTVERLA